MKKHLLDGIRYVFMDMDGTIYEGSRLYPTTIPFLEFLKKNGIGYGFLSNNSSYSTAGYVERLRGMGISVTEDDFYSSTDCAIDYLKRNRPALRRIFLLGMKEIEPMFEKAGFIIDDDRPEAVIIAFDRRLTYDRLCRAAWHLSRGTEGFATHPDRICPTDLPTVLVDCGSITKCLEHATGKKITVLGKPHPYMLTEPLARRGASPDQALMIGDRFSTDIATGVNAGTRTCHITATGEETSGGDITPTLSVRDLGELRKIWSEELEDLGAVRN